MSKSRKIMTTNIPFYIKKCEYIIFSRFFISELNKKVICFTAMSFISENVFYGVVKVFQDVLHRCSIENYKISITSEQIQKPTKMS